MPRPKFPAESRRAHSVRDPEVPLVEKVRADLGVEVEMLVVMAAILAVEVASVEEEDTPSVPTSVEKRMPAPMPFATVPVAVWEMERTSEMELVLASSMRAESAGRTGVEPQARVVEAKGEDVPVRMKVAPWLPKTEPCAVRPPPKSAP